MEFLTQAVEVGSFLLGIPAAVYLGMKVLPVADSLLTGDIPEDSTSEA